MELQLILTCLGMVILVTVIIYIIIYAINNNNSKKSDKNIDIKTIVKANGDIYNVKIWDTLNSGSNKILFPELCSTTNLYGNPTPNINKVSIAISGGGPRSCCATLGYFRALDRMGYKNKAQYVSSVSGGTWFYSLYSFCQTKGTQISLSGESCGLNRNGGPNPALITLDNLKNTNYDQNSKYFGKLFLKNVITYVLQALLLGSGIPTDMSWNYAMSKLLLEPNGLYNQNAPVALNYNHAKDINSRNPKLPFPLYPPNNMPFWISNTTLLFAYPIQYPYINVDTTLLYSGITHKFNIFDNNMIGGMVRETFAYGNVQTPTTFIKSSCNNPISVSLNSLDSSVRSLSDIIGVSSSAYGAAFYDPALAGYYAGYTIPKSASAFLADYKIWGTKPLLLTNSDSQCTSNGLFSSGCSVPNGYDVNSCTRVGSSCYSNTAPQCKQNQCSYYLWGNDCKNKDSNGSSLNCSFGLSGCSCTNKYKPYVQPTDKKELYLQNAKIADGGFSDNTGVISLVSRNVKRIISFYNADKLFTDSDFLDSCDSIMGLFGAIKNTGSCSIYNLSLNSLQIFKKDDYINLIYPQFQKTFSSGGPTFARATLDVIANENAGIEGGYKVDILFIMLQPSSKFNAQLPAEVRNEIRDSSVAELQYFPLFKTLFQNKVPNPTSVIYYTPEQFNILSSYTDWCLNQPELKKHVDEMYS